MLRICFHLSCLVFVALAQLQAGQDLTFNRLDPGVPFLHIVSFKVPRLAGARHNQEVKVILVWKTQTYLCQTRPDYSWRIRVRDVLVRWRISKQHLCYQTHVKHLCEYIFHRHFNTPLYVWYVNEHNSAGAQQTSELWLVMLGHVDEMAHSRCNKMSGMEETTLNSCTCLFMWSSRFKRIRLVI